MGVFAAANFRAGQSVCHLAGNLVHWERLLEIGGIILDNAYRFSENYYLSPSGLGNYFNHSCQPNAGIVKKAGKLYLVAVRAIKQREEVTFDYSTIIAPDDIWVMKCDCGQQGCRRKIRSITSLPKPTLAKYQGLGIISEYILP